MVHKHTSWQNIHTHEIKIYEKGGEEQEIQQKSNYLLCACGAEGPMRAHMSKLAQLSSVKGRYTGTGVLVSRIPEEIKYNRSVGNS